MDEQMFFERTPLNVSGFYKNPEGIRLEYAGKRPEEAILSTTPGRYEALPPYTNGHNRLYHADNLNVLATLLEDEGVAGKVKLVYVDPPFATNSTFQSRDNVKAYDDLSMGIEFIEALRERLVLVYHLLADDGSLYLHLDARMVSHFRVILDEIFGAKNFRNFITRKKSNPKNYTRKQYGNVSDYILFYSKNNSYTWNRPTEAWGSDRASKEYPYTDAEGRRYKKVPIHAPGLRNGETGRPWRGMMPPAGKHWQYTPSTLDEMDSRGEIYWSSNGNPRRKVFLDQSPGIPVQDIWDDVRDALNQNAHITGYPTEKNPALLRRIIEASSNMGDLVMDCYAGSGTTLVMADQLGRKWIGIDNSDEAIRSTLRRFEFGTRRMRDFGKTNRQTSFNQHIAVKNFSLYKEVD